ncbi:MAG: glycerate kinase, partial [Dehalococcoidia bacterium]
AEVVRASLEREIESVPGAGTGGGITAGILAALPRAEVRAGAALVAEAIHLETLVRDADVVVTGEGALDAQTAYGKTVSHVAALAARHGVPCVAVAGLVEARPDDLADIEALAGSASEVAAAIADAPRLAEAAGQRLMERLVERLSGRDDS